MNRRSTKMIKTLYENPHAFDIQGLASKYSISIRTIRNDINYIKEYVKPLQIDLLIDKDNKFYLQHNSVPLLAILSHLDFYNYTLNQEERYVLEFVILVFSRDYLTFSEIADFFCVSRSTIIADLDRLNAILKPYQLKIRGFSSQGIKLFGKEIDVRRYYMRVLFADTDLFQLFFNPKNLVVFKSFNKYFTASDQRTLHSLINENEIRTGEFLTEGSFVILQLYLIAAIFRVKIGNSLSDGECPVGPFHNFDKLHTYLVQYFELNSSTDEKNFLNNLYKNLRFIKKNVNKNVMIKIQTITRKFIENISDELHLPLYIDYSFFLGLSNHVEHIFTGGDTQIIVEYADVNIIVKNNQNIKTVVKNNIGILENLLGRQIQEQEIAYIVIYICAAIEKYQKYSNSSNVILVCNSGIGTSKLLQQKINEKFNFNILNVVSVHILNNIDTSDVDFLISTIELSNCKLPYVCISPLLNEEDYLKLQQISKKTLTHSNAPHNESYFMTKQLKETLKDYPDLFTQVQQTVKNYFKDNKQTKGLGLAELLQPPFIELDVEAKDWQDAICKAAQPLLHHHIITQSYIDAMIKNVSDHGPYIVIAHGFALPHASIDAGSLDVGMSLIRLKTPVEFHSPLLDPVRYVCVLSTIDQEKHLKAFLNMANLLKMNGFLVQLDQAKTPNELSDILAKNEMNLLQ